LICWLACAAAGHPVVLGEREIRPGMRIAMEAGPDGHRLGFPQFGAPRRLC
jgi:hypothetical protein